MLKKVFIMLLAVTLIFASVPSWAETQTEEEKEELLQQYTEQAETEDKYFNVPIRIGIIHSVNIRKDGLGLVFQPITGPVAVMSLKALRFLIDLKEIGIHLENGQTVEVPAVVKVLDNEAGTFIELNLTLSGARAISDLITSESPVKAVSFIQKDSSQIDMTIEELNNTLSSIAGRAVDITKQAGEAISAFWKNLTGGIGTFVTDAFTTIEGAFNKAGEFIAEKRDAAGEAVNGAWEAVAGFLHKAADTVKNLFGGLFRK